MIDSISAKASMRVLGFLHQNGEAKLADFDDGEENRILLTASGNSNAKLVSPSRVLDVLHKASLIVCNNQRCTLTALGTKRVRRAAAHLAEPEGNVFGTQHRDEVVETRRVNGELQAVRVNANESPLFRLKTRKAVGGKPWINDAEFEAGERLRTDFTLGQLMQNVTSSWEAGTRAPGKGGAGGKAEINDTALDARRRLDHALDFVGPELGGVLTDVCCFLKGLESVERERRWPPRSAKLMLRTALHLLSRHYGTDSTRSGSRKTRFWGGQSYRPVLE